MLGRGISVNHRAVERQRCLADIHRLLARPHSGEFEQPATTIDRIGRRLPPGALERVRLSEFAAHRRRKEQCAVRSCRGLLVARRLLVH